MRLVQVAHRWRLSKRNQRRGRRFGGTMPSRSIDTPYGRVEADPSALELGELLVSDEGTELEVVSLDPLRLEPAPEEAEDWGE